MWTNLWKKTSVKCWKYSGLKVWQSHFKEIIEFNFLLIKSIIRNSLITRLFNFHVVFSTSHRKRFVLCCKRKVAAVKIEKLKVFIIKCYDISKTYFVQFHLFGSVNLSYFYFFTMVFSHKFSINLKTHLTVNWN